jgi:hypothetical protein
MKIPENLIFAESNITINFAEDSYLNTTASSILIAGSRNGFLSLSNCLIYLVNSLENKIELHNLPFVNSEIRLTIELDEAVSGVANGKVLKRDSEFIWVMSETESNSVFTGFHSLGHLNPELHLDDGKTKEELSVYCVVL